MYQLLEIHETTNYGDYTFVYNCDDLEITSCGLCVCFRFYEVDLHRHITKVISLTEATFSIQLNDKE